MRWLALVMFVGLSGCGSSTRPVPRAEAAPGAPAPDAAERPPADPTPPGVKPHFLPCDPAHPEMPCTPDMPLAP